MSEHFKMSEWDCHDGTKVPEKYRQNVEILMDRLEVIRAFFDKPIAIISGYRTKEYNFSVGGAKHSLHMKGMAADFTVKDVAPPAVREAIEGLFRIEAIHDGGLGSYDTFTHLDIGEKRRWKG